MLIIDDKWREEGERGEERKRKLLAMEDNPSGEGLHRGENRAKDGWNVKICREEGEMKRRK